MLLIILVHKLKADCKQGSTNQRSLEVGRHDVGERILAAGDLHNKTVT